MISTGVKMDLRNFKTRGFPFFNWEQFSEYHILKHLQVVQKFFFFTYDSYEVIWVGKKENIRLIVFSNYS